MNHSDHQRINWIESILGGPKDTSLQFSRLPTGDIRMALTSSGSEVHFCHPDIRYAIDLGKQMMEDARLHQTPTEPS